MQDEPDDRGLDDTGANHAGANHRPADETGLARGELDDTALEEELRGLAARLDPVPERLIEAAIDAYAWRTVDTELAELVFDSLADREAAALVRGPQQERLLSFQASDLTIEVEVTAAGPARRLIGQLIPPQRASVEIRHQADVITLESDDFGRFVAESVPAGPVRLRCGLPPDQDPAAGGARSPVVTDWVPI